ncbi:MAG: hypothetical protein LBL83_05960 [Clostridiales bacterium]|jgi:hypothetical protein|nr:hypothetical protein [Clostridiales bacterium]
MAEKDGGKGGRGVFGRLFSAGGGGGSRAGRGSRMSSAEFVVAAAVLLLLEGVLLANFMVMPFKRDADDERKRLDGYVAEQNVYEANKQNAEQRQAYLAELNGRLAEQEALLPAALHNEDISLKIGEYARAHNIAVESVAFSQRELASPREYAAVAGVASAAGGGGSAEAGGDAAAAAAVGAQGAAADGADGAAAAAGGQSAAAAGSGQGAVESALADADKIVNGLGGLSGQQQGGAAGAAGASGAAKTMSVQGVQVSFVSEAHTIAEFLKAIGDGESNARIKSLSAAREQEGVIKGLLALEYVSLSASAEADESGLYGPQPHGAKDSLFQKYEGYVEEGVDPTILLVSSDDDTDPNFYMILNPATSNDTKMTLGVFPRTETAVYFNANNAARAKLTVSGDADQLEYSYALGSGIRSEKRRLELVDGKIRLDVISHPRSDEDDRVAVLLDVENNTGLPLEIRVRNDDVLNPRFHLGATSGDVSTAE